MIHSNQLKREEEDFSRKEREHRRKKLILLQQKAQEDYERYQRESALLDRISKQSKQERRIAEQYADLFSQKISF
jgi:hypothetical protein